MQLRGFRETTIEHHRYNLTLALLKLGADGIRDLSGIRPADIYRIYENTSDKHNFGGPMRSFLRYLFETGKVPEDYSEFVPVLRKNHPVPSVYTKDELHALLTSFDRDSKTGKRGYAIVLLALRLGIRGGDIVSLQIENIDFQHKKISFTQAKTEVKQSLELLPEVEGAITDYLTTARPISDLQNVFLSLNSPARPMSVTSIRSLVWRHFVKSGVIPGKRKCGSHALRMTLASELVAEKVPYDVVRKILGHESPMSTKHYVGFDIEALRACAIDVPPISGLLAGLMAGKMGGISL